MDEELRHQRDTSLGQLAALIRRGQQIKATPTVEATRAWQQDCAAAVNQLSGGSKAHWLARAYSGAFLLRSADGGVVLEADGTEIVDRILDVLAQGATALSRMDDVAAASAGPQRPRHFEFVHNAELRPVLERAFADSRDALGRGDCGLALILSCSVIEAVVTDALDHARPRADDAPEGPARGSRGDGGPARRSRGEGGPMADWSFETRLAAAEQAGLIRGGCARLPPVARTYRTLTDADGELRADAQVSERDARIAGQVLRVVMRDLDPGR